MVDTLSSHTSGAVAAGKDRERPRHTHRNPFRVFERDLLRRELADHERDIGNRHHDDRHCDRLAVRCDRRKKIEPDVNPLTERHAAEGSGENANRRQPDLHGGKKAAGIVGDIRVPIFAVGTESDHVAPWRSVFKIQLLTDADVTFALTTGGHNIGILGLPERRATLQARSFRIAQRPERGSHPDPGTWMASADRHEGSWWPAWIAWLGERSGKRGPRPGLGAPREGLPNSGRCSRDVRSRAVTPPFRRSDN